MSDAHDRGERDADGDPAPDEETAHDDAAGPVTASALLRHALVSDDDPRFPRWLPLPGIVLAAGWAAFSAATGGAAFLPMLLWPGAGIFALTTVACWLGWQLELD